MDTQFDRGHSRGRYPGHRIAVTEASAQGSAGRWVNIDNVNQRYIDHVPRLTTRQTFPYSRRRIVRQSSESLTGEPARQR